MSVTTTESTEVDSRAGPSGAVTFRAADLDGLTHQVVEWIGRHPAAAVVAFSHAAETHLVPRTPPSLSGPERRISYSGVLLHRPGRTD
jgi:hypothetical protein